MSALFSPCTDNFILIGDRQCSTEVSTSGLYLTDLGEAITTDLLANLAGSGSANAVEYGRKIVRRAALNFQDLVRRAMANMSYQVQQGTFQNPICKYLTTTNLPASARRGFVLRKSRPLANFGAFYIDKVLIKSKTTGTATLEIADELGVILYSKQINLLQDVVTTVMILAEFTSEILFVTIDNTAVETYKTDCTDSKIACTPCGAGSSKSAYSVSGWDGLQDTTNSFGLVFYGGVQCSFAQVICALLPYFSEAILKLCHVEILKDLLNSPRINPATIYADQSMLQADIEKIKNSANKSINDQMAATLSNLQKAAPHCITCDTLRSPYMVSIV